MSSPAEACSPDEAGMTQPSNYSLRWNNHQAHILRAFEELLHNELLVDVTLVCAEAAIKAHKVVLSACSPFFERIFAEHPCKHPTIVLKDFSTREMNHLIDFMYRGEVRVESEDLAGLMEAAESLQIRGLVQSEPRPATPPETPSTSDALLDEQPIECSTPEPRDSSASIADNMTLEDEEDHPPSPSPLPLVARDSAQTNHREHRLTHPSHAGNFLHREIMDTCSSSLLPRRKQARPRRRSGDFVLQDFSRHNLQTSLSPPSTGLNLSSHTHSHQHQQQQQQQQQQQEQSRQQSPQQRQSQQQQQEQQQQETTSQHHHEPRHRSPSSHHQSQQQQQQQQQQHHHHHQQQQQQQQQQQSEEQVEEAENLSMKKEPRQSLSPSRSAEPAVCKSESEEATSTRSSPPLMPPGNLHPDAPYADLPAAGLTAMSGLSMTPPQHHGNEYLTSLGQLAAQWLPGANQQNHLSGGGAQPRHPRDEGSPHAKPAAGFPYQPGESPLTARTGFGMDGLQPLGGTAGLFHHGAPFDLHDSFKPESLHSFYLGASLGGQQQQQQQQPAHHHHHHHSSKKSKKHRGDSSARRWSDHVRGLPMCRPKGQHSAPRGGPPRSWTNTDLTDALTMVWNKRMTTSQASRVFGIPYNSLLMYVRGKYGKSLKLEQLRRDCVAGEVMNSINNNVKPGGIESPGGRLPVGLSAPSHPSTPGHPEPEVNFGPPPGHPLLGQGFFPELAGFPVPVNMVHLLPPSEQNAFEPPAGSTGAQPTANSAGSSNSSGSASNGHLGPALGAPERSRSSSPLELSVDGLREAQAGLLSHNGSSAAVE